MPKLKKEEAGSFSKSEHQKLQRLYTQGGAAYGSLRNLVKASNLSVSKVRQFLHPKPSYDYKKIIVPKNFGLTREQKFLESFKKYAKLKEYKFTLQ